MQNLLRGQRRWSALRSAAAGLPGLANTALPAAGYQQRRWFSVGQSTGSSLSHVSDINELSVALGGRHSVSGLVATVFGGTGMIGENVTALLGKMGSQVVTPYRGQPYWARPLRLMGDLGQIVPLPFDMADENSIARAVHRSNVVINCVGGFSPTKNYSLHDTNVKTAYRVAKVAADLGIKKVIHISAVGADPDHNLEFFRLKAEAEQVVRELCPEATIIRATDVVGFGDHYVETLGQFSAKCMTVPVANHGQALRQPVWVGDVSRAVLHAILSPEAAGKTVEIGGAETIQEWDLVSDICDKVRWGDQHQPHHVGWRPLIHLHTLPVLGDFQWYRLNELEWIWEKGHYDNVVKAKGDVMTAQDLHLEPDPVSFHIEDLVAQFMGPRRREPPEKGIWEYSPEQRVESTEFYRDRTRVAVQNYSSAFFKPDRRHTNI